MTHQQRSGLTEGEDDSRITRMGRFNGKGCLDELPQRFDVISGERSFIGPRPIPCSFLLVRREVSLYSYRHGVCPGFSG